MEVPEDANQTSLSLKYGYLVGYSHATLAVFLVEDGQRYTSTSLPGTPLEQIHTCIIPQPLHHTDYYRAYELGWKCGQAQYGAFKQWQQQNQNPTKTGTGKISW